MLVRCLRVERRIIMLDLISFVYAKRRPHHIYIEWCTNTFMLPISIHIRRISPPHMAAEETCKRIHLCTVCYAALSTKQYFGDPQFQPKYSTSCKRIANISLHKVQCHLLYIRTNDQFITASRCHMYLCTDNIRSVYIRQKAKTTSILYTMKTLQL